MLQSEIMPLTMVQQDIYFDQLHYPNSPVYNIGGYINLPKVDVDRLCKAHEYLIAKHDAFGLRIIQHEGGVGQSVASDRNTTLSVLDFTSQDYPEQAAQTWLQQFFQSAIPVDDAELFRACLLKISDSNWYYVGMAHHISMDGWGFANWAERLGTYYQCYGAENGINSDLASHIEEPGKSWQQVIVKEQEYIQGNRYQKDKAYWQEQLQGMPEPLLTPYYHHQYKECEAIPSKRSILKVSVERHAALQAKAKAIDVPVAQLYQAMVASYFSQCFGVDELVLGSPIHNRSDRADKATLGAFISVIPVRLRLKEDDTFAQLCGQVKTRMRQNFKHQRYPAGEMRRELATGNEQPSLFQIGYNYLKLNSDLDIDGQNAHLVYLSHQHEQTPIMLTIWEYGEQMDVEIQIDHNLAYFSEFDINLLRHRFDFLMQQVLDNETRLLTDFQLIPEDEKQQLNAMSSGVSLAYEPRHLAHQLFEQQAVLKSDATALINDGVKYSFAELNSKANQLANYLLEQQCQPGEFIGIHCPRTVNMVVAILATMKVGATFVSLDPEYPESRINYIVQDSQIRIVLAESSTSREFENASTINLDQLQRLSDYPSENLQLSIDPEQIAYGIYTSGSTGNPKGVLIRHRNLLSMLHWARDTYEDEQLRSVLASTSLNFDLSMYELFVPLCFGFQCVLVKNALALLESELDISLINTVPSAAKGLLQHQAIPDSVNTVNLAGEPLPAQVVNGLLETTSCQFVYNLYGPSEDTTYSTCARFDTPIEHIPDIGRVIANSQSWVLTEQQTLAPIGSVGELYLSGDGVAAGYLNRPELTNEKFLELPGIPGKCYRTGDLVRYQSDGSLLFIGRIDDQVKLRGFRIELGEVEHALVALPEIHEAVVLVKENALVAYLVAQNSALLETSKIKEQLHRVLPHYMVPSHYLVMEAFPLTPNGKVDKKALPDIQNNSSELNNIAPANDMEERLLRLVSDVLELPAEQISMAASFFELGGHSLLAVNLTARIRQHFAVNLSLKHIFEAVSLSGIAELIEQHTGKRGQEEALFPEIAKAGDGEFIPLSLTQQRLWFIDQVQGHSRNYHMPFAVKLVGKVDVTALETALRTVIQRHEVLRSIVNSDNSGVESQGASLRVLSIFDWQLQVVDLTNEQNDKQQAQTLDVLIKDNIQQAFDLSRELPIRTVWFDLGEEESALEQQNESGVLFFNIHHIAFDGWSVSVFLSECTTIYQQLMQQNGVSTGVLPELHIQYSDYAIWQNTLLQQGAYQSQLEYWQQQLSGAPLRHSLPMKSGSTPNTDATIDSIVQVIEPELFKQLNDVGKQHQLTLFMQLHAALSVLLSRHSNTADIVIGTPVANRGQIDTQSLIGFFVNTLALRIDAGVDSVAEFLQQIRDVNLQALDNQDVPFDKVVEACQVERNLDYTPLFQILLTLNEFKPELLTLPNVEVEQLHLVQPFKKFELEIEALVENDSLSIRWTYDTSLFDKNWITTLTHHFHRLLRAFTEVLSESGMAGAESLQLAQLPMLSKAEHNYLVNKLNSNALSYSKHETLISLFEQQVVQQAQSIALHCAGRSWSFSELNQIANGLALRLIDFGVRAGDRVGVSCHRNMDMVVSLLAIHKVGASYVPLDPAYPASRRLHIVQDSQIKLLITHPEYANELDVQHILVLNEDELLQQKTEVNPDVAASSEETAYTIYTSGSTGMPKGVEIRHRNAVAMLTWANQQYQPHELKQILASTSLSFDLSIYEIFLPLCFGYQCVLVENALALLDETVEVSLINTVPSAIKVLADQEAIPASVKVVNLAGEPLKTELVNQVWVLGVDKVCNLYGPSEDTTYSTYAEFTGPIDHIPEIGRAISNSQAYILSEQGALLPFGVAGELYLGGDGVAKGYINQPDLTAQKFIANPFGDGVLYRTGDLVRYRVEDKYNPGSMDFLGRLDDQVKVRGFRIELGEIEQVIKQQEKVDQVCVIAVGDGQERRLAAFVVAKNSSSNYEQNDDQNHEFTDQLNAYLVERLPDYMIPGSVNIMEALPLTPNGKIDKKALSQLDFSFSSTELVLPQTELEKALHAIWTELLPLKSEQFGITDNFFSLGGHSILAVRLNSEIARQLSLPCSVKSIFNHPTIQQLAAVLSDETQITEASNEFVIAPVMRNAEMYPLSFAQQRLWFLNQLESEQGEYNMPASLDVVGHFQLDCAERALQTIVQRHEVLRCRFVTENGKPGVVIEPERSISIELHDVSQLHGAEQDAQVQRLLAQNATMNFDLAKDALLKVSYVKLSSDSQGIEQQKAILLFNMHHIISDGWSLGVLLREFMQAYQAELNAQAHNDNLESLNQAKLPDLSVQYIDYAAWQQDHFKGERLQQQLKYWQELMADAPSSHSLPLDRKRGTQSSERQETRGASWQQTLSRDLCQQINSQLTGAQATLFMFMQAALALHIGRLSHEHDVVMGAPVAGREQHQLQDLIGLFLNTQLYRSEFSDNPSWSELLQRTRTQHLNSVQYSDVPFEAIVEKLNPVRDLNQSPLFQILINYNNTEQVSLELDDCQFVSREGEQQANKYDITLYIHGDLDSGVTLQWAYDSALFDASTIEFYGVEFEHLLAQLIAKPEANVLNLGWKHSQPWQALSTSSSETLDSSCLNLFSLIEQQAEQNPTALALTFESKQYNYQTLIQSVNQLANYLLAQGFQPGHRAAIYLTRSEQRVIAILATLKLGGCYVPLSQELPDERVEYMLQASQSHFLLTDEKSIQQHDIKHALETGHCVVLDEAQIIENISNQSFELNTVEVQASSEAHIIFTSGSTGLPKAVAGNYDSTLNRIQWMLDAFPYQNNEAVAHITSMAFIRGVWELLVPLCGGAHLVLCDRETVKDTRALWQWMQEHRIERMVTAPSLMKALSDLAQATPQNMTLSHWFVSGEPLLQAHANDVLDAFPNTRLFNLYGSTEVMSDVLYKEVSKVEDRNWVSVGKAINNVDVFILGDDGLPAPNKVIGEIAVAGKAISNGYLPHTVSGSSSAFIDTPIGKVYRTGDQGFIQENGEIECLGRFDDQVKIRGYRVEPGEVTTRINKHPAVKSCYVRAMKMQGEYQLVAYIVSVSNDANEQQHLLSEVKAQLAESLPAYMHPSFYQFLPEMPLRPNGKVDRQALPEPDVTGLQQEVVAPATELEKQVLGIWAELLQLNESDIGVTTSFFDLGGHSLLATRLMKQLEEQYQLSLSYKEFFASNSIRYIAERIEKARLLDDVLTHSNDKKSKKNNKLVI